MIKMAAMLIYGKILLKYSSLEPKDQYPWDLVHNIEEMGPISLKNDDLGLILTFFTERSFFYIDF